MKKVENILEKKVSATPFIDTHEHLIDESERLSCLEPIILCDDWTLLLSHYFRFDLISSGMPKEQIAALFSKQINPIDKWELLKDYWPYLKNTASGSVFRNTVKVLYDIDDLSVSIIKDLQNRYAQTRQKGFYKHIIRDLANISHCHVHSPIRAFRKSESPDLLFQDIAMDGLIRVSNIPFYVPDHIKPKTLTEWYSVINWWFNEYGNAAKAVKIGIAYFRRLDFEKVQVENAEQVFIKKINSQEIGFTDEKLLQDHLFWYCIDKATEFGLPVKMHTGHWAMNNIMNMHWVNDNPADCASLCRQAPDTKFIFFHLAYPHYEEMLSLSKSYSNAYIDMCWSWTVNPLAAKDFLKKFIMTVPNNKIFTFGGDDIIVENLIGHAAIARKGITQALSELVSDDWITLNDAIDLTDDLMYRNAEKFFK